MWGAGCIFSILLWRRWTSTTLLSGATTGQWTPLPVFGWILMDKVRCEWFPLVNSDDSAAVPGSQRCYPVSSLWISTWVFLYNRFAITRGVLPLRSELSSSLRHPCLTIKSLFIDFYSPLAKKIYFDCWRVLPCISVLLNSIYKDKVAFNLYRAAALLQGKVWGNHNSVVIHILQHLLLTLTAWSLVTTCHHIVLLQ